MEKDSMIVTQDLGMTWKSTDKRSMCGMLTETRANGWFSVYIILDDILHNYTRPIHMHFSAAVYIYSTW